LTYLLDNNVVSYFLHCRREADLMDAGHRCPLAIDAVVACYPGRRPTWWADWRAKLGSATALV
jgi:hypothetical protein